MHRPQELNILFLLRRSGGLARQPATALHRVPAASTVPAANTLIDLPFVTSQGCHGDLDMTDLGDTRAHFAMLALLPKIKLHKNRLFGLKKPLATHEKIIYSCKDEILFLFWDKVFRS